MPGRLLTRREQPWPVARRRQQVPLSFQNLLGQQELPRLARVSWRFRPAWSPLPEEWMAQVLLVQHLFRARAGPLRVELQPGRRRREWR